MFVEERHQEILNLLKENEKVKVKDLSERFGVTQDCIRKDLAALESQNVLKRTYGGAVLKDAAHPGHSHLVSARKDIDTKEKEKIAQKAVRQIKKGDVIFLDTATTNIPLAKAIAAADMEVTVVSCMMDIAAAFVNTKNVKFILLGGEFNRDQNGFSGTLTIDMMKNFRFDACFMGVVGADADENIIMTYAAEDGLMKANAIEKSRKVYLMMENKKFEYHANYVYADFSKIDGIICESDPKKEVREKLESYQVQII